MAMASSFPTLVYSSEAEREEWNFYNVADKTNKLKPLPGLDMGSAYLLMSTPVDGGWVLVRSMDSPELFLFSLASFQRIPVPPLVEEDCFQFSYSMPYPPSHPDFSIVAVHVREPYWLLFRPGSDSDQFSRHEFPYEDFFPGTGTCCSAGKVYVFGGYYLATIDPASATVDCCEIEHPHCVVGSYDMLDMLVAGVGGELLVVEFNYFMESDVLHSVEVSKLDLLTKTRVIVDDIGDQAFFIAISSSMAVSSSGGVKKNRIYFADHTDEERLCCYDLDLGSLTVHLPCPDNNFNDNSPLWVMLDQELPQIEEDKDHCRVVEKPNALDFLSEGELVTDCLGVMGAPTTPCLLFTHKNDGNFKLVNPFNMKSCRLHLPQLAGSVIYSSVEGWLVVHKTTEVLFLFNLFTREEIQLPTIDKTSTLFGLAISSPPTSPECMIFGIKESYTYDGSINVLFHRLGDTDWTCQSFPKEDNASSFTPTPNNPVFHNGLFYCLSKNGAIGVYDPHKERWTLLSTDLEDDELGIEVSQCYLVGLEGKLLAVFMDEYNFPRRIFQLRDGTEVWEPVSDFEDGLLFLGKYGSMMGSSPNEERKNSICLQKFEEECDYEPLTLDPWEPDLVDYIRIYPSTEYTLNSCWIRLPNQSIYED